MRRISAILLVVLIFVNLAGCSNINTASIQTIKGSNIITEQPMLEVKAAPILKSDVLNNKSLSPEKAINAGDIAEINYTKGISAKTHNHTEIYNISKLDNFMDNIINEKKDKIRIVKYASDNEHTWVNKLYDLDYDGRSIKIIVYDTYSDPNKFIPSEPSYSDRITKREYQYDLWYGSCLAGTEGHDCSTLMSFKKSSIVK